MDADLRQAMALGIQATPTLLVNGRRIVGAPSVDEFRSILEDVLRERR